MKVTVEKEELQRKLADIQNIVEKKNTMPILNCFLLSADKEKAYITATDLGAAFKEPITLNTEDEGRMCIPAKKLFEIVREIDGSITLESEDSQWVKVKSGKSYFRLACLSADEFPIWPSFETTEKIDISPDALLEMIERTFYAAGEADTRQVLNGLLFHIKPEGGLTIVGTDGHRMAFIDNNSIVTSIKDEKELVISRKSIAELRRFLNEDSKTVDISVGKNHILFKIDGVEFLTRLIEGTYPNYEQVIPAANKSILTADRNQVTRSLRRVSVMSRERSNAVKMDIENNSVVISAANPDLGEAKDEISVDYSGEPLTIAFNAKYILDALNVMEKERVIFKLGEPLSPTLLIEEGRDDYRCVIMPMRL